MDEETIYADEEEEFSYFESVTGELFIPTRVKIVEINYERIFILTRGL